MSDALKSLIALFEITEEWEDFAKACLATSVYTGALVGSLLSFVVIKFSYRRLIIVIDGLLILGSMLEISGNLYIFLLGRFIAGVGCGMHSIFIPLFIKMISPK